MHEFQIFWTYRFHQLWHTLNFIGSFKYEKVVESDKVFANSLGVPKIISYIFFSMLLSSWINQLNLMKTKGDGFFLLVISQ